MGMQRPWLCLPSVLLPRRVIGATPLVVQQRSPEDFEASDFSFSDHFSDQRENEKPKLGFKKPKLGFRFPPFKNLMGLSVV